MKDEGASVGVVRQQPEDTFVLSDPTEILKVPAGLRDVRVLQYRRRGPKFALVIERKRCHSFGLPKFRYLEHRRPVIGHAGNCPALR